MGPTSSHVAPTLNPCPVQRTIVTPETNMLVSGMSWHHTVYEWQHVEGVTMIWPVSQTPWPI